MATRNRDSSYLERIDFGPSIIKLLVELIAIVVTITLTFSTLSNRVSINERDIDRHEGSLIELHGDVGDNKESIAEIRGKMWRDGRVSMANPVNKERKEQ